MLYKKQEERVSFRRHFENNGLEKGYEEALRGPKPGDRVRVTFEARNALKGPRPFHLAELPQEIKVTGYMVASKRECGCHLAELARFLDVAIKEHLRHVAAFGRDRHYGGY